MQNARTGHRRAGDFGPRRHICPRCVFVRTGISARAALLLKAQSVLTNYPLHMEKGRFP